MAPKQKAGQKPKPNAAEEVEETFQAVVGLAVGKWLRDCSCQSPFGVLYVC